MSWKELSYSKKALILSALIGLIFGIYSNLSQCHTSPGGPNGCSNKFQLFLAGIEFLMMLPSIALFSWNSNFIDSMAFYKLSLLISPIVVFGVLGSFISWIYSKLKKNKN